jgi:hypothetical protein
MRTNTEQSAKRGGGCNSARTVKESTVMSNYLRWTGHHRAIAVTFALLMLGCLMVLAVEPFGWVDIMRPVGSWALLTGFALAIPAFVGLCVFVRCPRCRVRLIWHAVSKNSHPRGINNIMLAPKCPFCGFPEPAVP